MVHFFHLKNQFGRHYQILRLILADLRFITVITAPDGFFPKILKPEKGIFVVVACDR
jgi:hypothetical protein